MIEVALTGRLSRDAELRHVKGGELALCTFAVVVEGKGEDPDAPRWVRVAVFGDQAEQLANRLVKGVRAYVEGRLTLEQFEGRDGRMRAHLNVVATLVQPMGQIGRRRPSEPRQASASQASARTARPYGDPPRPGFVHAWALEPHETPFFDDSEAAVSDLEER